MRLLMTYTTDNCTRYAIHMHTRLDCLGNWHACTGFFKMYQIEQWRALSFVSTMYTGLGNLTDKTHDKGVDMEVLTWAMHMYGTHVDS